MIPRLLSYALFEGRPLTTRGRWINPVVFAHFALEKRLPVLRRVVKPVFIIGTGRSGTTILGVVMSMHRQVGFLNEPKALWHSIYPREDVIGNYTRQRARYRLDADDADEGVVGAAHRLFGAYLWLTRQERLVDKYPELVFRVPFVQRIFPDARFVFLMRSGWDTCHSIETWSRRKGVDARGEVHDWWGADRRKWELMVEELVLADPELGSIHELVGSLTEHLPMAAVEWVVTMREGLRRSREHPHAVLPLRYEDLVSSPRAKLQELLGFCELPSDERFVAYGEQTLSPAPPHPRFDLPAPLRELFDRTMAELGYGA